MHFNYPSLFAFRCSKSTLRCTPLVFQFIHDILIKSKEKERRTPMMSFYADDVFEAVRQLCIMIWG